MLASTMARRKQELTEQQQGLTDAVADAHALKDAPSSARKIAKAESRGKKGNRAVALPTVSNPVADG